MPLLQVPKSFFVSERNTVYANWKTAFWRELISNSLDAECKTIKIRTSCEGDNLRVDFVDNGIGMDRDIIESVYMKLGESTKKESENSVGGFGRARLLVNFSQESYYIRTQSLLVKGDGANYDITDNLPMVNGTAVSVVIEGKDAPGLMYGLRDVLRQSSLRVPVLLDLAQNLPSGRSLNPFMPDDVTPVDQDAAKKFTRFSNWSRKGSLVGDLSDDSGPWAHVHVNAGKTANPNRAVVRVNGIAMYDDYVEVPKQVTIDLVPERAREVLTASRDSIRGEFRHSLTRLFGEISADSKSALKSRSKEPVNKLFGSPTGSSFNIGSLIKPDQSQTPVSAGLHQDYEPSSTRHQKTLNKSGGAEELEDRPTEQDKRFPIRLPFALHVGDISAGRRSVLTRYSSETWENEHSEGRNAELLHSAWTGAVKYALTRLFEVSPPSDDLLAQKFVTGFVFDDQYLGMHKSFGEIDHGILLNPVDENGRQAYKTSSKDDLVRMSATALHEVAHCLHDWHNENYAGLLTRMVGHVRERDLLASIKEEVDITREWQRAREMHFKSLEPVKDPDEDPRPEM